MEFMLCEVNMMQITHSDQSIKKNSLNLVQNSSCYFYVQNSSTKSVLYANTLTYIMNKKQSKSISISIYSNFKKIL